MKSLIFSVFLAFAAHAWAQPQVAVDNAWVRGTVAQQTASGAFMRLTANEPARLVQASSPVAGVVEIHEMTLDNHVMRMRAVPALELPAGRPVELQPGGFHVMLMDLKQPLSAGQTVPITLVFEDRNRQRFSHTVQAPVRALGAPAGGQGHGPQGHGHGSAGPHHRH